MKRPVIILLLLTYSYTSIAIQAMYISAKPISCQSYNYEVEITFNSFVGSDILFGDMQVNYGDGVIEDIALSDYTAIVIDDKMQTLIFARKHSFSGPGIYNISVRFFNRSLDIINMDNSINTPMYIEMMINIDPFLGCNQTPTLENIPAINKMGSTYFFDFSFIDEEHDSISFHFTAPLQMANTQVVNYWQPNEKDETQIKKISRISIDPFNGSLLWNIKELDGRYAVAFKVNEWRKVDGVYYQMSSSTLDYSINLQKTNNMNPGIMGLKDTAIIAGNKYFNTAIISDPDRDSIRASMNGDFFKLMDIPPDNGMEFFPGPIKEIISFTPLSAHVRSKPYKAIYTATDKNDTVVSLSNTASMYVWITDRDHKPDPPDNFTGQALGTDLVNIYWNDSEDELGYIVERADIHFPNFLRFVVLPANTTHFIDSSVVENNIYRYRITAMGTKMSASQMVEVTTPDIVTALKVSDFDNEVKIFPNPSVGNFNIVSSHGIKKLEMFDLTGKKVWEKYRIGSIESSQSIFISTGLSKGIYIINFIFPNKTYSQKILIK